MIEVEINTIEEYLNLIKQSKEENVRNGNQQDFLFRGQMADYPLIPKLCRLKAKGNLLDVERLLLQEFKRTNPLLLDKQQPMDDWDYLTLGQHFGLPTRLLDWSYNALTALWFATGYADPEKSLIQPYSVVWILMAQEEDFALNIEAIHPFDVPKTKIVRPRIIKQRINNQSGVFSVPSSQEMLDKCYMNETDSYKEKLIKVKIPCKRYWDIRIDMNTLGVNAFTIFPELEGLCTYLQWRYFE
ncbi:FRG domain-containing protein [Mucilaginibacter robiniae]|uniref:FRG domain-containing protein n=1 Tax=Mucilaginibacter robiniae TaxID=2728022 RepID=A0A7L5DUY3_9SPHI|nr:FRG domain-containing protein [Mucilaginibacter robiniae]QJD94862.1 FRG domain-containing protein [Mucilaginibacter robiniae]